MKTLTWESVGGLRRLAPLLILLASHGATPALAQEEAAHGEEGEEHSYKNAVALVAGMTYESSEEETYASIGGEYERIFTPRFAGVVAVEYVPEVEAWVMAFPLVYRFDGGLRLGTGPGVELKPRRRLIENLPHGEGGEGPGLVDEIVPQKTENFFLWRFGVGYTFEISKRFEISPWVNLDVIREEDHWVQALVVDVAIGFAF